MTNTNRSPEIRLSLSLDGTVRDVRVVADSVEDRDRALAALQSFLPALELLESIASNLPKGDGDDRRGSSSNTQSLR
jgi:hypothetical protein